MLKHLIILGCAFAGFFLLVRGVAWYGPYTYDQADYMYAVSQGWEANAFDTPSMPLADFLKIGMSRGRDPGSRADLSSLIRGSNDVLFYRHWHGPLYGYWLAFTERITVDARAKRKLNYLFAGAAAILLYFGAMWLLEGTASQIAAVLCLVLYWWSYPVVKSSELAPHQLFAVLVVADLLLLAKMFGSGGRVRRYWYAAVVVSALAFCVLEVAFALILTVLWCGWAARQTLKPDWRLAIRSLGAFLGTVLIFWPAAVLKLSPVKSYLFMAYLAAFRKAAWGDDLSFGTTWRLRLLNSPVPWLLLAAGVVYFLAKRKPVAMLTPFAVFSVLMFLATFRVTTNVARYELPLLPGIVLFGSFAAALVLADWSRARRNTAVALVCATMLITSWPAIRSQLSDPVQQTDTILALLREHQADGGERAMLVPQEHLPMVHYYFPGMRFRTYYDESEIANQVRGGDIAGVITRGSPPRLVVQGFDQIQPRAQ
jgi:hypothetical protein